MFEGITTEKGLLLKQHYLFSTTDLEFLNKLSRSLTKIAQWRRLESERVERALLKKDGVKSKESHLGNECLLQQDRFGP